MNNVDILFNLDKKFCEESQVDKELAWMKYTADDSKMGTALHEPYLEKKEDIDQAIKSLYNLKNLDFTWKPLHGGISDDNTMGFTTGTYQRSFTVKGEMKTQIGKYVTIWKKISGSWKIVFDMGN